MQDIITLGFLILLQVVLGFDNLLYISLESKRAPEAKRTYVRRVGIVVAIVLRIGLLFALMKLIEYVQNPLFHIDLLDWVHGAFNVHSLIVLAGGVFIIYTATKEIWHMVIFDEQNDGSHVHESAPTSVNQVIAMIVVMNLVFSFDSILSAMALTHVFWVMAAAIVIGGLMMIWLADRVSAFLAKNRMYEVLGLFVLFIVGIMLLSEGGHLAHLTLFGAAITPMSKATFYFTIGVLVVIDLVQSRYQKKLLVEAARSDNQKG
ncbi:MAG: tellurium resistance protein TerC [Myxococcales bacterium]|nr:tellurium resistance protein TerC [Myxococcales bacterium]